MMKVRYYNSIRAVLLIIIIITSYYVITAGTSAFVTEGFQGGCHDIEYAQFTSMCANSIRGSGANRPVTPQVNNIAQFLQGLPGFKRVAPPAPKAPDATAANAAFLRLLTFINPSRNTPAAVPFRDMIKCLFFTCDSYVKVVPELTNTVSQAPLIFTGARQSAPPPSAPKPADDLRTVLGYLDTRRTVQDEPRFFTTIRDLFMADGKSTLRNDIEFGRLLQLVNPEHVFRAL
jgi:hypothetical protein